MATVRIRRWASPLSPTALRAALIRLKNVDSETIRPPQTELQQVLLGDDVITVADEVHQQIEHLRFQRNRLAGPPQFATRDIEHIIREAKLHLGPPGSRAMAILKRKSRQPQG